MSFDIGKMLGIDPAALDRQFEQIATDTSMNEQHLRSMEDTLDSISRTLESIDNHLTDIARDVFTAAQAVYRWEKRS